MTIPFLDLFKKLTARFSAAGEQTAPAQVRPSRLKKPDGQRLSKTVLPHATRSFARPDPFQAASGSAKSGPSLQLGARKIVSGTAPATASRSRDLPPALALALEPKLERAISLRLSDFLDQVPAGYIKPVEILDASAEVSLKASEIEKGMPEGKPSISLPSLYQQVPEIFLRSVPLTDETRVALPYEKVLEQFNSARVRTDQERDPSIPQVDTPILQATIEDTERFGTKMEPLQSSILPPVHVEPATAKTLAAAEPEATAHETIKSTAPPHPVISLHSPDLKPANEPASRPRIPFLFPPNGTGGPASERVPASCGPPVPTTLPPSPEPARIPFRSSREDVDVKAPAPSAETSAVESVPASKAKPEVARTDGPTISLALKPILQNVSAFQLQGDTAIFPDDARVDFALSLIEPQLASGRIAVAPEVFQAAMPAKYRDVFHPDEASTPVLLPLEEVLKNLPASVLKLRDDQEDVVTDKDFETPFSIKAREDKKLLQAAEAAIPKIVEKASEPAPLVDKVDIEPKETIDAKEVIARTSALPGLKACAITFSDGLSLAGNLPPEIAADGLCAMAPSLLQKIDKHMRESKLGPLVTMTLYSADVALSFFAKGNICLAALHGAEALAPGARAQLAGLVEKLSHTYAQPETSHVDH
jgi:predicted regulator of Ras-like GTPase activity (Roadblock/LC7/MglB family)